MAKDSHGRLIDYLRISVTDRCNLRCVYCMPADGIEKKSHCDMLSLEEIERMVRVATTRGITRVRLTGGEPLVRKGICDLVESISSMEGIQAVALTTNGVLLPKMADDLKRAGLSRVNISLDTLDPDKFHQITRLGSVEDTLAGVDAALEAGFDPVKINSVVIRSLDQDFLGFARLSYDRPLHIRFIEYMPLGDLPGMEHPWTEADIIPSADLYALIDELAVDAGMGHLEAADGGKGPESWGPARYYRFAGAKGTLGFITPRSRHFCGECNRLRLTADGKLRPCLFSDLEFDVKGALRDGTDEEVAAIIDKALCEKPDSHHDRVGTERKMFQIGG